MVGPAGLGARCETVPAAACSCSGRPLSGRASRILSSSLHARSWMYLGTRPAGCSPAAPQGQAERMGRDGRKRGCGRWAAGGTPVAPREQQPQQHRIRWRRGPLERGGLEEAHPLALRCAQGSRRLSAAWIFGHHTCAELGGEIGQRAERPSPSSGRGNSGIDRRDYARAPCLQTPAPRTPEHTEQRRLSTHSLARSTRPPRMLAHPAPVPVHEPVSTSHTQALAPRAQPLDGRKSGRPP